MIEADRAWSIRMTQQTLAGFEKYCKTTRRAQFLAEMEQVVPWAQLCALIEPVYPKGGSGEGGRPPVPLERMLWIYLLQLWFNLSDPAVEDALYDSAAPRCFARVDLGREPAPDETTVCKFPHLLEKHKLGEVVFKAVNRHLHEQGIKVSRGTIVDASIISAPSSTKNKNGERAPEMHQTAKGKQWYIGMKADIGVDSKEKIIHTVKVSAANVADSLALPHLLHGKETRVYGDQAYRGQGNVIRKRAPKAKNSSINATVTTVRSMRPSSSRIGRSRRSAPESNMLSGSSKGCLGSRRFGTEVWRNAHRMQVTCALANLFMVRRRLLTG